MRVRFSSSESALLVLDVVRINIGNSPCGSSDEHVPPHQPAIIRRGYTRIQPGRGTECRDGGANHATGSSDLAEQLVAIRALDGNSPV